MCWSSLKTNMLNCNSKCLMTDTILKIQNCVRDPRKHTCIMWTLALVVSVTVQSSCLFIATMYYTHVCDRLCSTTQQWRHLSLSETYVERSIVRTVRQRKKLKLNGMVTKRGNVMASSTWNINEEIAVVTSQFLPTWWLLIPALNPHLPWNLQRTGRFSMQVFACGVDWFLASRETKDINYSLRCFECSVFEKWPPAHLSKD